MRLINPNMKRNHSEGGKQNARDVTVETVTQAVAPTFL